MLRSVEVTAIDGVSTVLGTADDAAAHLNAAGVSATAGQLAGLLAVASRQAEAYCGVFFAPRRVVESIDAGEAVGNFVLAHAPLIALVSISRDDEVQPLADFRALKAAAAVRRKDGAQSPAGLYEVTYTAGFETAPVEVIRAVYEIVRDAWANKGSDSRVKSDSAEGVGSTSYFAPGEALGGGEVPPSAAALLAPYVSGWNP